MAYQAISRELRSDVTNNIRNMRNREMAAVSARYDLNVDPSAIVNAIGTEGIERVIWGEHYHLKAQMPSHWMQETQEVTIVARYKVEDSEPSTYYSRTVYVNSIRLPPRSSRYLTVEIPDEHKHFVSQHLEHFKERNEVEKRWTKTEIDVIDFLDRCKSLNEALKLWEELAMFVPEQYINKVNQKVTRTKTESDAAEFIKTLDKDAVVSNAVLARMVTV